MNEVNQIEGRFITGAETHSTRRTITLLIRYCILTLCNGIPVILGVAEALAAFVTQTSLMPHPAMIAATRII